MRIKHNSDDFSFREDWQAPERVTIRGARDARRTDRPRRQRTHRKTRTQRSMPLRIWRLLLRSAACARGAFDGVNKQYYKRD